MTLQLERERRVGYLTSQLGACSEQARCELQIYFVYMEHLKTQVRPPFILLVAWTAASLEQVAYHIIFV